MPVTLRPYALVCELTYRCPLKCPYCSNPLQLSRYANELDTATWKRVLDEAAALGVVQAHLSGGEPMLRRDLCEIIAHATALDLYTNLSTGATVADENRLQAMREAGLDSLQVSVLDAEAAGNDRMAGLPSFEQKQQAVATAKRLGFPITLNFVLHRQNLDRIEDIIDLAVRWQADRLELAHTQYTGWAFRNRAALIPTRQQLQRAEEAVERARQGAARGIDILHVLPDYLQSLPKACLQGWGRVFMTVAPDGAVLPCQTAREIPGLHFPRVHDHSLEEIWFRSEVFNRFRGTEWMPEPCRSCDRREIDYGGCRCQAFLLTGDAGATDPVCQYSPDHAIVQQQLAAAEGSAELVYREMRS
jgi:pyrroloquinoline quinone biosynthesis protein E